MGAGQNADFNNIDQSDGQLGVYRPDRGGAQPVSQLWAADAEGDVRQAGYRGPGPAVRRPGPLQHL
ncbi:hypothetical protein SDC9_173281 [bioreactor metagenome]|uniref:Uncharacterized protein n=1 Tax=bioreactor metagenome TaxID=1076179 RepID=A0A645GQB7_9ZZZZ